MIQDDATLFAGRRLLLLAPHADDVAYSIGGLVARLAPVARLQLLTVFPRSAWALPLDLRRAGPAAVQAVRRAEDERFCAGHGMTFSALDFGDSSYHGYDEARELSEHPDADPRTPRVFEALDDWLSARAADLVIAPAAIGDHVDHRIVFEAARRVEGIEVLFYEDIPYAAWNSLDEIGSRLTVAGLRPLPPLDIGDVVEAKIAAMWSYASQTSEQTIAEMLFHAERVAGGGGRRAERIWARA